MPPLARALALGALLFVPTANAGTGDAVVRVTVTDIRGSTVVALPTARANGRQAPLSSVASLVPAKLPAKGATSHCLHRGTLTIGYAGGHTVGYSPCLPKAIATLGTAVRIEAANWSIPPGGPTAISGADAAEQTAMLLELTQPARIASITIKPLSDPGQWGLHSGALELGIDGGASTLGQWEAKVFARKYLADVTSQGLRPIGVVAIGTTEASIANVYILAPRPQGTFDPDAVLQQLQQAGYPIVDSRNEGGSLVVTMQSDNPAAFLKSSGQSVLDILDQSASNQYFLALEDAGGAVVYTDGKLVNGGAGFARPDLAGCVPISPDIVTPWRPGAKRPPCPA